MKQRQGFLKPLSECESLKLGLKLPLSFYYSTYIMRLTVVYFSLSSQDKDQGEKMVEKLLLEKRNSLLEQTVFYQFDIPM